MSAAFEAKDPPECRSADVCINLLQAGSKRLHIADVLRK